MSEEKRSGKKGCLFLIVGTILAFVGTGVYILLSGWISSLVIQNALGGRTAYALLTASLPCMYVVFLLLDGVLVVNYLPASPHESGADEQVPMLGQRAARGFDAKVVRILSISLVAAILPVTLISVGTYRTISDEGISNAFCFIQTSEYQWEQVSYYEIECDSSKGLSMTFTMRDGSSVEILQGTVSSPDSFKEKYDSKEAFAVDIAARMAALQIPCKTFESQSAHNKLKEAARSFYKGNEDLWPHVMQLVGYEEVGTT